MNALHAAAIALFTLPLACSSTAATPAFALPKSTSPFDPQHQQLDALLARYVVGDGVNYQGLIQDRARLDQYLANLVQMDVESFAKLSREDRFAFWINAYNGFILRLIVEHYPIDSIRDLGGTLFDQVWDQRVIPLGHLVPDLGQAVLSYSELEHKILRPQFADARVHAAINCASESCPPLLPHAFVGATLDRDLDRIMQAFVQDPRRNQLKEATGQLELSSLFDWFAEDFERDQGSVRAYVAAFAGDLGGAWIESAGIRYLDYSWALNDASIAPTGEK